MSFLGVHFALTEDDAAVLLSKESEQERLDYVTEDIEERYIAQSDKSWDAMHRLLADGLLTWNGGEYPLNHTVLGGEVLYGEDDYIMSLKTPQQVQDIAAALEGLTESTFRERYYSIDKDDYDVELSEEDFDYT